MRLLLTAFRLYDDGSTGDALLEVEAHSEHALAERFEEFLLLRADEPGAYDLTLEIHG